VKPIDHEMVAQMAESHDAIVTVEEHVVMGGAGSAVLESMHEQNIVVPVLQLGLPDHNIDHGEQKELLAIAGLDGQGIQASIEKRFGHLLHPGASDSDSASRPRLVS
jgi:1-deoxy-D-xylulose-5-phosphate synthase